MDALDRAGQAGNAADVLTPTALHPDAPSGKRFGDLTRVEVGNLATIAQSFGRRGDAVMAMWQHTQQKLRAQKRVSPRVDKRPKLADTEKASLMLGKAAPRAST